MLFQVSMRLSVKVPSPPRPTMSTTAASATKIPKTAHSQVKELPDFTVYKLMIAEESTKRLPAFSRVSIAAGVAWASAAKISSRSKESPTCTIIRSEEHTSELQSRGHLVCRLLLEKKKGDRA